MHTVRTHDLDRKTEPPALAAWRAVLNAHAAATARIEAGLSAAGLPPLAWYDVLWTLYRAPERRLRMGELAEGVVVVGRTGLSRLVDRLEAAGLVDREAVPEDRRGSYAVLTDKGVATLREMWPVYAAGIDEHFGAHLTAEDAGRLARTLGKVGGRARAG